MRRPQAPFAAASDDQVPTLTETVIRPESVDEPEAAHPTSLNRRAVLLAAGATGMAWISILLARLFVGGAIGMGDRATAAG